MAACSTISEAPASGVRLRLVESASGGESFTATRSRGTARTETYPASEKELEAYFCGGEGDVGFRAQRYDGGVPTPEDRWSELSQRPDERPMDRAHAALRRTAHRAALLARSRVESVLWQLDAETRRTLALGFGPFGAGRLVGEIKLEEDGRERWWCGQHVWAAFKQPRGNLLALILEAASFRESFAKAYGKHRIASAFGAPGAWTGRRYSDGLYRGKVEQGRPQRGALEFLDQVISSGSVSSVKWVEEAEKRRGAAVALYEVGRAARVEADHAERKGHLEALRARLGLAP